jgi:hypothetical protein
MSVRLSFLQKSLLAVFAVLLMLFSAPAFAANTLYVDDDGDNTSADCLADNTTSCNNIQKAVDQAADGDTIIVRAGIYPEDVVISTPNLTLKGPNEGTPGADGSRDPEAIIDGTGLGAAVTISVGGVTIDGFTITDAEGTATFTGTSRGVLLSGDSADNAVIQNNIFEEFTSDETDCTGGNPESAQAVYLSDGPDSTSINNNKFNNISSGCSAKGVFIGDSQSPNPAENVVIDNNVFMNIDSTQKGGYAILINSGEDNVGLTITNNAISFINGAWANIIGLEGNTPDGLVEYNTITDIGTDAGGGAVGIHFESNPSFDDVEVHKNSLDVGDTNFAIALNKNLVPTVADRQALATCNWYGDASGPIAVVDTTDLSSTPLSGAGSPVSVNVNYDPWLGSPDLDGPCPFATLELVKELAGNGTAEEDDWNLEADGTGDNDIDGGGGFGPVVVEPDTYVLSETRIDDSNGEAYNAGSWVCVDNNDSQATLHSAEMILMNLLLLQVMT